MQQDQYELRQTENRVCRRQVLRETLYEKKKKQPFVSDLLLTKHYVRHISNNTFIAIVWQRINGETEKPPNISELQFFRISRFRIRAFLFWVTRKHRNTKKVSADAESSMK